MNKKTTLIVAAMTALICIFALCAVSVSAETDGIFNYSENGKEATVTGLTDKKYEGALTIPDYLGRYPVKSIGKNAFSYCSGITSVTIGDLVTVIGEEAFSHCSLLADIRFGDSVQEIGINAFLSCTGLTAVKIPGSVTNISYGAFSDCTGLETVNVPSSLASIGGDVFKNTKWYNAHPDGLIYVGKVAYRYKGECPSDVNIEEGTLGIAGDAFRDCAELEEVTIPSSVTCIRYGAFMGCTKLMSITVPSSVTSISGGTFTENVTVRCEKDSYVESYCYKKMIRYEIVDPSGDGEDNGGKNWTGKLIKALIIAAVAVAGVVVAVVVAASLIKRKR